MARKFRDYINIRESEFETSPDTTPPESNEVSGILHQAIDIAWKKDKAKILATLRDIAQNMEKGQLHLLLDKIDKSVMGDLNKNPSSQARTTRDEYIPPVSDGGFNGAVH